MCSRLRICLRSRHERLHLSESDLREGGEGREISLTTQTCTCTHARTHRKKGGDTRAWLRGTARTQRDLQKVISRKLLEEHGVLIPMNLNLRVEFELILPSSKFGLSQVLTIVPLLSFKTSLGLRIQLLVWSSNLKALCEHAATSWAGHICSMRGRARTSPTTLTCPHLLPVFAVRTVRNHVGIALAILEIIEIEHEGPVVRSVGIHFPRDQRVACGLRISIAVPISQCSYGAELSYILVECRTQTSPGKLARSLNAPNYVRSW